MLDQPQPEIQEDQVGDPEDDQGREEQCQGDKADQQTGGIPARKVHTSDGEVMFRSEAEKDTGKDDECDFRELQQAQKHREQCIVESSDAVIQPLAVVVEPMHTPVAEPAVLRFRAHARFANSAERGVLRSIEDLTV